ncbi:MAG: hypothetical protein IKO35_06070 [Elusimicrobiaceae bacterium]|nr:hypothetical protein [Elusimicrobiaceae bacterium]
MPFFQEKKTNAAIPSGKQPSGLLSFVAKKPFLALLIIAALPIVVLIAFTFKSGYNPTISKHKTDQIIMGKTPIEMADEATALLQKRDTDGFIDLLQREIGANVNMVNSKGDPLLLVAATLGNLEAVREIILAGADVNKKNAFTRDTALLRTLYYTDNSDIARLLVYSGADINAVNNYNHSPMFLALE